MLLNCGAGLLRVSPLDCKEIQPVHPKGDQSSVFIGRTDAEAETQLVKIPLQCGRPGFNPWVGKIPWRREKLCTPVFQPEELHGPWSPWGHKESGRNEQLSLVMGISVTKCFNNSFTHTIYTHVQVYSRNRTSGSKELSICNFGW